MHILSLPFVSIHKQHVVLLCLILQLEIKCFKSTQFCTLEVIWCVLNILHIEKKKIDSQLLAQKVKLPSIKIHPQYIIELIPFFQNDQNDQYDECKAHDCLGGHNWSPKKPDERKMKKTWMEKYKHHKLFFHIQYGHKYI